MFRIGVSVGVLAGIALAFPFAFYAFTYVAGKAVQKALVELGLLKAKQ